jgi:hypothetical protein
MAESHELGELVLRQRLALGNHEAAINDDIDLLAEHLSLAVSLRDIHSLLPDRHFRQRSSTRIAGDIALTAATGTPLRMELEESSECSIALFSSGTVNYVLEGSPYRLEAGQTAMFLPGMHCSLETEVTGNRTTNGLVYNLSPQLLARYLCEASDGRLDLDRALQLLQRPHPIDLRNPALQPVLFGLQVLVRTIDSFGPNVPADTTPLSRLQEGMYALSAALLLPDCASHALASWQHGPSAPPLA